MGVWDNHWKGFDVDSIVSKVKSKNLDTVQIYNRFKEMQILRRLSRDKVLKEVCDFGSGMGIANIIWGADVTCTLIDNSEEALIKAKGFHEGFNRKNIKFLEGDILEPSKSLKGKFDLTWSQGVLEHFVFEDQIKILDNMAQITKPGGYVVIMVPNKFSTFNLGIKFFEFLKFFGHKGWQNGYEKPLSCFGLKKLVLNEKKLRVISVKGIVPFVTALPIKNSLFNKGMVGFAKIFEDTKFADWFGREVILFAQKV